MIETLLGTAFQECLSPLSLVTIGSPLCLMVGWKGSLEKYDRMESFDIYYSSSREGADGAIERMVMGATSPERICVVTNDNLIRNCAYANGASAMRVEQMIKRLDYSIDEVVRKSTQSRGQPKSKDEPFYNRIEIPGDLGLISDW